MRGSAGESTRTPASARAYTASVTAAIALRKLPETVAVRGSEFNCAVRADIATISLLHLLCGLMVMSWPGHYDRPIGSGRTRRTFKCRRLQGFRGRGVMSWPGQLLCPGRPRA